MSIRYPQRAYDRVRCNILTSGFRFPKSMVDCRVPAGNSQVMLSIV